MLNLWLILLGALGLFFGMPNPALHFPPLLFLCPFSLYLLAARSLSTRVAFVCGWLLGSLGQSLSLYWLTIPMADVGQLPIFLAVPAVVLLGAYLSLYYGLVALVMHLAARWFAPTGQDSFLSILGPVTGGLAFAACEILCGRLFTGFPWLNLASGFAPWPSWIQVASILGSYGTSAVFAIAASTAALAVLKKDTREKILPATACLIILAAVWSYGHHRLSKPLPVETGSMSIRFVAVQGNINQNQKWTTAYQTATINHYFNLTQKGLRLARSVDGNSVTPSITMALWPETAMPFSFETDSALADRVRRFALSQRIGIGFGTLYHSHTPGGARTLANRFLLVDAQGGIAGHYDKEHLVPFGEYIPGPLDFAFLRNIMQGIYFTPGISTGPLHFSSRDPLADAPRPPLVNGQPQVITGQDNSFAPSLAAGVLICYEAIFPELAQDRVKRGADILVNVSNDGWFGKTSAPSQHLGLAAMRAVEQGRYLVRGTNTGYTALITPYGIVEKRGELYQDDVFILDALTLNKRTPFHYLYGFVQLFLAFSPAVLLIVGRIYCSRSGKQKNTR